MGILWILLSLSFPIFYVMGVVHFFRCNRKKTFEVFAKEIIATRPHILARELLDLYEGRETPEVAKRPEVLTTRETDSNKSHKPLLVSNNWYEMNSINILLYVGALLIVTAGFYFVRFQWTTISGIGKASIFSLFALAFLILGLWWERLPKIKTAGITFISIGAVLIPLSGIAWYNFVFEPMGVELGLVWLATSIVTFGLYAYLLKTYQNIICSYALNVAMFSSVLSLVNLNQSDISIYIIVSLIYALIILVISYFLSARSTTKLVSSPISTTAQIVVPLSLATGIFTALSTGKQMTLETAYAYLLGAIFYGVAYYFDKKTWRLAIGLVLLPMSLISLLGWMQIGIPSRLAYLSMVGLTYAVVSLFVENKQEERKILLLIGFCLSLFTLVWQSSVILGPFTKCLLVLMPGVIAVLAAVGMNNYKYLVAASVFVSYSMKVFFEQVLKINPTSASLPVTLAAVSYLIFLVGELWLEKNIEVSKSLQYSAIVFGVFGVASTWAEGIIRFWILVSLALICGRVAWNSQRKIMHFLAMGLITWSMKSLFVVWGISDELHPLGFTLMAVGLYIYSLVGPESFRGETRLYSLFISILFPYYGGQWSISEKYSLVSFYITTVLFASEALIFKNQLVAYFASAIAMITYVWQIKYLGVDETLFYNIPIGLYFMALAQHRRILGDTNNAKILDIIGFVSLLLPSFFLAFGTRTVFYSIALGAIGISLLILGITVVQTSITNAGIAGIVLSILPQTYQYILKLPRFIFIGSFGLMFLVVAIYLLWKRTDSK